MERMRVAVAGMLCVTALALLAQPAMAQLKPGVTQSAAHTANVTGTVRQSSGAPVAGAAVALRGQTIFSTKTDARGSFAFTDVPWGAYQLSVTSALGTASQNLTLKGDVTVAIQYQTQGNLRTIAHVSTESAGAHINVTSSSVISVNPSDYAFEGEETWRQVFAQLPGVTLSGRDFAGEGQTSPYSPEIYSVPTLNGAQSYETLTTLDGMPLQGTSDGGGIDLSLMPMNSIEGLDIVRGPGANAPSIVDSIGGTIVLHAPGDVTQNQWEVEGSTDPFGGALWNARVARRLGKLSVTVTYGTDVSPGPLGSVSDVVGIYPGTPLTIDGQAVNGSTYSSYPPSGTFRGSPNCYCAAQASLLYGFPLQPLWMRHDGAVDLTYQLTPTVSAEVFYEGSQQTANENVVYKTFTNFDPTPGVGYHGDIAPSPPGEANYPLFYGAVSPLAGLGTSVLEEKVTASIGPGVLRLGALQGNYFETELGFGSPPNGLYRLWGTADVGAAPGTPTAYNGTPQSVTFFPFNTNTWYWSNNRDLLGSYALQVGSSSSVGVSYTTSYYNDAYTQSGQIFGIPFSGGVGPDESETTGEWRAYFTTDISDKFSLGLSWYSAVGTYHIPVNAALAVPNAWKDVRLPYSAPRLGVVWRPNDDIAVRASAGGGYALPLLTNLLGAPLSCNPSGSPPNCSEFEPNPNLKPEKAFAWDLGTDMRLHGDTVLSFDTYRTDLYGSYYTFQTQESPAVCGPACGGLPLYIEQFNNLAHSRMEGVNLEVRSDPPVGLYWTANLGLTRGYVVSVNPGFYNDPALGCKNCVNQGIIPGSNFNTDTGETATVPYASAYAQAGYRWRPSTFFDLAATYYGNNNGYYTPKAFVEVDAHAGYAVNNVLSFLVDFVNVTGVYDDNFQLGIPSYNAPSIPGASPNAAFRAPLIAPYGPRAITLTAVVHGN